MGYSVFSEAGLAQVVRAGDSRRFNVDLREDRQAIISAASTSALAGGVTLDIFHTTKLRGKPCVSYRDYERALVLRSVAKHLKRRLGVVLQDRNRAVRGVIASLLDATPMTVIRCDIESFYETVPTGELQEALIHDTASSTLVRGYLQAYFECHCPAPSRGLPRGAGLSAILSELAIRPFDEKVKALPGVYRYFRFADDIIAFTTANADEVMANMRAALPSGMKFNRAKSYPVDLLAGAIDPEGSGRPRKEIEYLGYLFSVEDASGGKKSRKLSVSIAPKKIKRLKSKLILSFHEFNRTLDARLLVDRVLFLSSNYKVKRTGHSHSKGEKYIKSGIYYNYALCGNYSINQRSELVRKSANLSDLKALDGMFRSLLRSRRSEFRTALYSLRASERGQLMKLSFAKGYENKMLMRVTPERVSQIKRAWRNV